MRKLRLGKIKWLVKKSEIIKHGGMGAKAPVSECLGQTTSVPFHLVRYVEGKDLARFDQRCLKSGSESEWKATLLLAFCVSHHKVINTVFHLENYVETLPAERMMSIHSGVAGPGGGKHPMPHGTVGKSPPWASGDWSSSASIGRSCDPEQTLHKTDLITSTHLLVYTANFYCNVSVTGIKK